MSRGEERRVCYLKSRERERYRGAGSPRCNRSRKSRRQPKYQRALQREIQNHDQASGPQRDSQQPEHQRLYPVAARAHVPEEIDVDAFSGDHALRGFEHDAFIVGKHHPLAVQRQ